MTTLERIKERAKKFNYNLQTVAEKSEIGINTIYKWKNYDPKGTDLAKVADTLHTTTDYLLCRTDDPDIHKDTENNENIRWQDLGMPYGGYVPDDFKDMVDSLAESYLKNHPELLKDKNKD